MWDAYTSYHPFAETWLLHADLVAVCVCWGGDKSIKHTMRGRNRVLRLNAHVCVVRFGNEGIRCVCAPWVFCCLHAHADGQGRAMRRFLYGMCRALLCCGVPVAVQAIPPSSAICQLLWRQEMAASTHECCSCCTCVQGFQRPVRQWGSK